MTGPKLNGNAKLLSIALPLLALYAALVWWDIDTGSAKDKAQDEKLSNACERVAAVETDIRWIRESQARTEQILAGLNKRIGE